MRDNVTWIKLYIARCKDPSLWYSNHIGEVWLAPLHQSEPDRYWVRDSEGYLNFIYKSDVAGNPGYKIKVIRCSNPVLWYNSKLNEEYEVVFENDKAVWVKNEDNQNAWIYKYDCQVI